MKLNIERYLLEFICSALNEKTKARIQELAQKYSAPAYPLYNAEVMSNWKGEMLYNVLNANFKVVAKEVDCTSHFVKDTSNLSKVITRVFEVEVFGLKKLISHTHEVSQYIMIDMASVLPGTSEPLKTTELNIPIESGLESFVEVVKNEEGLYDAKDREDYFTMLHPVSDKLRHRSYRNSVNKKTLVVEYQCYANWYRIPYIMSAEGLMSYLSIFGTSIPAIGDEKHSCIEMPFYIEIGDKSARKAFTVNFTVGYDVETFERNYLDDELRVMIQSTAIEAKSSYEVFENVPVDSHAAVPIAYELDRIIGVQNEMCSKGLSKPVLEITTPKIHSHIERADMTSHFEFINRDVNFNRCFNFTEVSSIEMLVDKITKIGPYLMKLTNSDGQHRMYIRTSIPNESGYNTCNYDITISKKPLTYEQFAVSVDKSVLGIDMIYISMVQNPSVKGYTSPISDKFSIGEIAIIEYVEFAKAFLSKFAIISSLLSMHTSNAGLQQSLIQSLLHGDRIQID